jgi:hypothetical protein
MALSYQKIHEATVRNARPGKKTGNPHFRPTYGLRRQRRPLVLIWGGQYPIPRKKEGVFD